MVTCKVLDHGGEESVDMCESGKESSDISNHEKENNSILPNDAEGAQTNKRSSIDFVDEHSTNSENSENSEEIILSKQEKLKDRQEIRQCDATTEETSDSVDSGLKIVANSLITYKYHKIYF